MVKILSFLAILVISIPVFSQAVDGEFKIALPKHNGQLRWTAPGFKAVESSAKPNGNEVGTRGENQAAHLNFLGFLFVVTEQAPLTSTKCRDKALGLEKKGNPTSNIDEFSEEVGYGGLPVSLVKYRAQRPNGRTVYMERGFIATGDICGDLEFYSDAPIGGGDFGLKKIFASYQFDPEYVPQFRDVFAYAQILYNSHQYAAAAPIFELALGTLRERPEADMRTMTRVITDQAGMAYGISGDTSKARTLFERAIAEDPDYPLYYYNLACTDAGEKNLKAARAHLQKAFERRSNVLPGESMPDPTKDDSFLPYRDDKDFWAFLNSLGSKP
jgi:tetratricopeptide (TPR) repeat protein